MRRGSGRRLAHDLLERGDALHDLHPSVHAKGQHALVDGGIANFRRADVLEDELAQIGAHRHDLVYALPALHSAATACVTALAPEEGQALHETVDGDILEEGRRFLRGAALGVLDGFRREAEIA